jgi:formate/nitrite transporter FocA (FNT family)
MRDDMPKPPPLIAANPDGQEVQAKSADVPKVLARKSLSAKGVHDALLLEGREEINRAWTALAWSGLAAGLAMGLTLMAEGALRAALPETGWRPALSKIGYTFGFIAVTLGRQQLFTESTLTAYLPWAHDKTRATFRLTVRLWCIVLLTNLIGGYAFAAAAAHTNTFSPELREAFRQIGEEAARHDSWTAFVKGIFGGWLIALMVWLMPSADSAKIWIIMLVTWLLAVTSLTHIVAGSVEVFYLVTTDAMSFWTYLTRYGAPVFIGNTIGGVVFVAALNHAQAASDDDKR